MGSGRATHLALQQLQARTAAGGDVAELVLGAVVGDDGRGIAPSDDDGRTARSSVDVRVEQVFRAAGERRELEHAGRSAATERSIHQYAMRASCVQVHDVRWSVGVKGRREKGKGKRERTRSTGWSSPQRPPHDTARCSSVRHRAQATHRECRSRPSPRRSGRSCRTCQR